MRRGRDPSRTLSLFASRLLVLLKHFYGKFATLSGFRDRRATARTIFSSCIAGRVRDIVGQQRDENENEIKIP